MRHTSDKITNEKFVTAYTDTCIYTRALNLNQMLLRGNRRCKAAKKKFARVPGGSYKLITLVQARQTGGANDEIFSPQAQITGV